MKIFSMSVYGSSMRYIVGALRQFELCQKYFPDWQVRIYTDNADNFITISDRALIIPVSDPSYGVFWRFRPLFESTSNIVVVRDSDSRITQREQMAVNLWIQSSHDFHVIKDHEAHYEWPVNAGMFACRGKLSVDLYNSMVHAQNNHYYTSDQVWLKDHVWPQKQTTALVHSMNVTGWFSQSRSQLINPYSFIGNGYDEHDMPIYPHTFTPGWTLSSFTENDRFDEGLLRK
jgi:hypothetical protein